MFDLPNWLLIFPVLGSLIFVHELGHFVTAKRFGVRVIEFGFGFPPRIFGVQYGETLYSINWIPIGGFVRMAGEEDPSEVRSFARLSVPKRVVVLVAGSFMNLVVPVVIFTILFMLPHGTLINFRELPAYPFRTDTWPLTPHQSTGSYEVENISK